MGLMSAVNRAETYPYSSLGKLNIISMSTPSKLTCIFNAIAVKIPDRLFCVYSETLI